MSSTSSDEEGHNRMKLWRWKGPKNKKRKEVPRRPTNLSTHQHEPEYALMSKECMSSPASEAAIMGLNSSLDVNQVDYITAHQDFGCMDADPTGNETSKDIASSSAIKQEDDNEISSRQTSFMSQTDEAHQDFDSADADPRRNENSEDIASCSSSKPENHTEVSSRQTSFMSQIYDGHQSFAAMDANARRDELLAEITSDSESWCSKDFEMDFLEEDLENDRIDNDNPVEENDNPVGRVVNSDDSDGEEDNPDDPDDPGHDSNESSDEEEDSGADSDVEEDDGQNFNFNHDSLHAELQFEVNRTVKETMLLDIALNIRHRQTYESLIEGFQSKNVLLGRKYFPSSKKELWRILGRNSSSIISHVYCHKCMSYIGKKRRLPDVVICNCGQRLETRKAKYFIVLDLKKQLEHFLSIPGIVELLRYREQREKLLDGAIEDVFDGEEFQRLRQRVQMTEFDYTYVFSSDGAKMAKRAKTEVYPVFVRLNELSPQLRQKFMFLAAVFVDVVQPDMVSFLHPVVLKMNRLSEEGILWCPDGHEYVRSRFFPLCFCVDAKERWRMLNMSSHSAHFACTYCTFRGVSINRTMRYPALPHPDIPPHEDRTDQRMKLDMAEAHRTGHVIRGHKGVTPLMLLRTLDLSHGAAADDLHNVYECAAKVHTNLLLTVAPRVEMNMGYEAMCNIIDQRLKCIKTPSCISRKPGTSSITKRGSFTGTEWRNWTIYAAVPCLQNLIQPQYISHFALLSRFAYILSQDLITDEDLREADHYVTQYLQQFERFFGIEATRMNMHALPHAVRSVRDLGAYWVYSTFNFESWINKIIKKITSPKGAILQIVVRHLMFMHLEMALLGDRDVSEDVRIQLKNIMTKKRLANARQVGDHTYLCGIPRRRNPTGDENAILLREGLETAQLQVFKKALIRGARYQRLRGDDVKSDDSRVYTFQDTFCTVTNIVSFLNADGIEVHGMFVIEHDVAQPRPFQFAKHIAEIIPVNDIAHFISIDQVRVPAVTVPYLGRLFIIALPNLNEID